MNKLFILFFFAFLGNINAQTTSAPKFINYQGIARDAAGVPITNPFDIHFIINNPSGIVHDEIQSNISPNTQGIFATQIGKSPNTLTLSTWDNGPFSLDIFIRTGSTFTFVGTQQLVSVPFALFAGSVPSSYTNNILSIGSESYTLNSGALITPTLIGSGLASITPTSGNLFSINVPTPTLTYNSTGNILTLTQGVAVTSTTLTGSGVNTITMIGSGNAVVSPTTGNSFLVNVPAQVLSNINNTISLSNGGGVAITPMTTLSNGPGIGVSGNPILGYTITNTNPAINYTAGQNISINSNTISAPNYSLTFFSPTLGILTNGSNSHTFTVTSPTITAGTGINITGTWPNQTLSIPSFTNVSWVKSGNTVTLNVPSDNVGIGVTSPTAKLDVTNSVGNIINANTAGGGNVINANTTGAGNVINANTNGGGFAINATSGGNSAINASNSGNSHTIYGANSNTSTTSTAGFFDGGLISKGKTSTSTGNAITVQNASNINLMQVRNDGNVGINTAAPISKLHVTGQVTIVDGFQGDGKVLVSNTNGTGTWKSSLTPVAYGNLNNASLNVSATGNALGTSTMQFTKIYTTSNIELDLHSRAYAGVFTGATKISFELRIDGIASPISTKHYIFSSATTEYIDLKSIFTGLTPGLHTISVWGETDAGTSTNVLLDPSGWGGKLILKEVN